MSNAKYTTEHDHAAEYCYGNRLDLETLGYFPITPKNLPEDYVAHEKHGP